ncbi:MAG: ECF-type sigma factor [Candidatus Polarisedimenticolaceae bacterium]|nr:ECF-type sigma factor [Candidatus Polarisedimenticolaceae bacterium]
MDFEKNDFYHLLATIGHDPKSVMNLQIDNTTYLKLKRIAAVCMRDERHNHTLSPTALVNEAYLRLHPAGEKGSAGHRCFLAAAARDMRQILVDHARAKKAEKRGGGLPALTLDESIHGDVAATVDILALNSALEKMAMSDMTRVHVVEMRYFCGMTLEEIAAELEISVATVKRKWTTARAWLFRELSD